MWVQMSCSAGAFRWLESGTATNVVVRGNELLPTSFHFLKEDPVKQPKKKVEPKRVTIRKLEQRIAPGQSHFPPGQFPAGNPGHAPGQCNDPGNSK